MADTSAETLTATVNREAVRETVARMVTNGGDLIDVLRGSLVDNEIEELLTIAVADVLGTYVGSCSRLDKGSAEA